MTAAVASGALSAPPSLRRLVTGDRLLNLRQRTLRSQESASPVQASGKPRPVRLSVNAHHPACGSHWTGARTAHCAACHLTTSGIHAFDAHQRISDGVLHCLPPDAAGLVPAVRPWGVLWTLPIQDSAPWVATKTTSERETIMPRKSTAPARPQSSKHDPDCPGHHADDLTCEEFDRLHDEHQQTASQDCPASPSRTQPDHAFDFSGYVPDDETECLNGCGMTWDRLRGAE